MGQGTRRGPARCRWPHHRAPRDCPGLAERKLGEEALSSVNRRLFESRSGARRIARDLHDDFGQRLALLSVGLGELKGLQPDFSGDAISVWTRLRSRPGRSSPIFRRCRTSCTRHGWCCWALWPQCGVSAGRSREEQRRDRFSLETFPEIYRTTRRSVCSGSSRRPCTTRCNTAEVRRFDVHLREPGRRPSHRSG